MYVGICVFKIISETIQPIWIILSPLQNTFPPDGYRLYFTTVTPQPQEIEQ